MICFVFSLYTLNKIKLDDLLNINQEIDFLETENKDDVNDEINIDEEDIIDEEMLSEE